jgi:hypothetical protein
MARGKVPDRVVSFGPTGTNTLPRAFCNANRSARNLLTKATAAIVEDGGGLVQWDHSHARRSVL